MLDISKVFLCGMKDRHPRHNVLTSSLGCFFGFSQSFLPLLRTHMNGQTLPSLNPNWRPIHALSPFPVFQEVTGKILAATLTVPGLEKGESLEDLLRVPASWAKWGIRYSFYCGETFFPGNGTEPCMKNYSAQSGCTIRRKITRRSTEHSLRLIQEISTAKEARLYRQMHVPLG